MLVLHLIVGTALGLTGAAASLLLGFPASTTLVVYALAGALGVIASATAALVRSTH
jgi:hypothetical protein